MKEYAVVSLGIRKAWNKNGGTTMSEMEEEEEEWEKEMGSKRKVAPREREIEWTRSQGCYYSYGMGGGGASESRRIAPRRVVRLGYQMVRTSSGCTIVPAIPSRAWYLPRVQRRGPCAVSCTAVAARLHTTLVSPNYLVLVVRSGDRKLTARAENIDRLRRPEAPCNEAQANGEERRGEEREERIQSR